MLNALKHFKSIFALFSITLLTASQPSAALAGQNASAQKTSVSETVASGANGKFELTIDNIMRGPGLVGNEPRAVHWSPDSQRIYFQWKEAVSRVRRTSTLMS